ncbi:MAG: hypothetical protein A2511_02045 [Deltaproteobacteria bacterium RIFOXYD12_FULL_50_9]|nr:MAG: hypothetical protein A2511_02045 [Deltaproteobacteria bacterium RIFOXYD12_FULL_50_9]
MEFRAPSPKAERIVVDEIMDNGTARILRAPRLPDTQIEDLSIKSWGDEEEDFISAWRIEAFVGYDSKQHLAEGDVFFIVNGAELNNEYKPINRREAMLTHLLLPWDESRRIARNEIKMQYQKLAASEIASKPREEQYLIQRIENKFK